MRVEARNSDPKGGISSSPEDVTATASCRVYNTDSSSEDRVGGLAVLEEDFFFFGVRPEGGFNVDNEAVDLEPEDAEFAS